MVGLLRTYRVTWITLTAPVKPPAERAEPPSVGPDLSEAPRTTACPSCGAGVRPGADWCSLCYHDLRPAPAAVTVPQPSPAYGESDPLTVPLLDLLLPAVSAPAPLAEAPAVPEPAQQPAGNSWPCLRCGARNALDADTCQECFSPFLGGASAGPSLRIPVVGDVWKMSRGARMTLAFGVVLALLVPLAVITFLVTDEPASKPATHVTVVQPVEPVQPVQPQP
jgi:ribosomal protein L40E